MKLYEKEILIPLKKDNKELLVYFRDYVLNHLHQNEVPVRFAITKTDEKGYHCELGIMSETNYKIPSIFDFRKRGHENNNKFNVALVVPTGIDALIGGHAGDAGPMAILLANSCDTLITHPNVVNASDINEMTENTLYVEGSVLSKLMMGTIGLQRVKSNRLEVILEEHEDESFTNASVNSVNAARATLGIWCNEVIRLRNKFGMRARYSSSGRAVGEINELGNLCEVLEARKGNYDSVALSSIIDLEPKLRKDYFFKNLVNPWGGVEAMLTHTLSSIFGVQTAHSPMEVSREVQNADFGIVDPRKAAETVSTTYLHCVLKGLHRSPRIIDSETMNYKSLISVLDVSCLVIPDKCIGLPTLAALEQNIPVIAVKGNKNLMRNDLNQLHWKEGQFYKVENYLEAVGIIYCMRAGIDPKSVRRPLDFVKINGY